MCYTLNVRTDEPCFPDINFQKLSVMQLYAFICRRVHINHLKLKQQVVTLLFRHGYAFDTASLQSTSGDIACCAECSLLSIETISGDIALKNAKCSTIELCSTERRHNA